MVRGCLQSRLRIFTLKRKKPVTTDQIGKRREKKESWSLGLLGPDSFHEQYYVVLYKALFRLMFHGKWLRHMMGRGPARPSRQYLGGTPDSPPDVPPCLTPGLANLAPALLGPLDTGKPPSPLPAAPVLAYSDRIS